MKRVLTIVLCTVHIAATLVGAVCAIFYFYCELFGYNKGNELLLRMNVPINHNGIILVSMVCAVLIVISLVLRDKCLDGKRE